ncbi:MAG: electron transfer flavoprotein subunit alpha/FixB family protein, partial [Burkholderiales bacterium]|nr:electron transfer flavoprotein subunit alpha/FixB family protein [Burkholderiales bacterium]
MTILIIAEHDGAALKPSTLNTVAAAAKIGGNIHVLVAGSDCAGAASSAAAVAGVAKVLVADAVHLSSQSAENLAAVVVACVQGDSACTHVLAPATPFGKNVLPRAAA